ncbi:unnamed protein product, partial [Linum tenue]
MGQSSMIPSLALRQLIFHLDLQRLSIAQQATIRTLSDVAWNTTGPFTLQYIDLMP